MKILLKALALISLILLLGVLVFFRYDIYDDVRLKGYNIDISHSDSLKFITASEVEEWLFSDSCAASIGTPMDEISTDQIEYHLNNINFVTKANVTKTISGTISIDIEQSKPIFKVYNSTGQSLYVDQKRDVFSRTGNYTLNLPVVTCGSVLFEQIKNYNHYLKKVDENYYFLDKLFNFVEYVGCDLFWNSQIAQINITDRGIIELVPRIGNHEITMCFLSDVDNYKVYLDKLFRFYDKQLSQSGWGTYKSIDLKFNNMIVCKGVSN